MKLKRLLAALVCSVAAVYAEPGSILPVTFALVVTKDAPETSKVLANGNTEFAFSRTTQRITNTTILAETQRLGLMTAGTFTGWQIVAALDRDAELIGFFAYNKTLNQAFPIPQIMSANAEQFGHSEQGKVQRSPVNALLSGSLTYTETGVFEINLLGVEYIGIANYTGRSAVRKSVTGLVQWVDTLSGGTFAGFGDDQTPITGRIGLGSPVLVPDMSTLFAD